MRVQKLRNSGWLACLTFVIGLTASTPSHADALDTVLDVLYKAGVIDGNVQAAKPLISCLAKGNSVQDCTVGAAGQTELANDPQVKNVIDIYQSFQQHDWYAVLKKAGITVGCALIPGGEIKDVVCGELGKIAGQVLDGAGSVLGEVGGFVTSMFGGGSDPPPISPQDYYTLNFMPWYHWSVVHQLDNDTPANVQVLNAPMPACVDYFYHHTYSKADAQKVCGDMRTWLSNNGYAIGNAFRQETDSYYQLHFAPKIEDWAVASFNKPGTIDSLASGAMVNCLINERKKIPLPEPGFEQCDGINPNNYGPLVKDLVVQLHNQCMALATQRTVPKNNDAYTRICTPITNRVSGAIIFAMNDVKSRMNAAAAAGCPNDGTPKSIHCDTYAAHDACVNALPEHASMCKLDSGKAASAVEAGCSPWETLSPDKHSCVTFQCPADTLAVNHACVACPSGTHSNDPFAKSCFTEACPPGQGLLPGSNDCGVCPPDTERNKEGICAPCTQGAHSNGGDDFCSVSYFGGGVNCPAGTVHPAGDNNSCVCAPGTEEVGGLCKPVAQGLQPAHSGLVRNLPPPVIKCPGATNVDGSCAQGCTGTTVPNPQRPGTCAECPAGTIPNSEHTACGPPVLKMRIRPIIKSSSGGG